MLENPHDPVVRQLQDLRRAAGEPSYATIARSVAALRMERGVSEDAALPPRTTVYDAFRLGRRRLDADLVADLTAVLARAAEEQAARVAGPVDALVIAPASVVAPVPVVGSEPVPEPGPRPPVQETVRKSVVPAESAGAAVGGSPTPSGERAQAAGPAGPSRRFVVTLLALSMIANLAGMHLMLWLELPIYLDMIGTALAAVLLGPWWGVGVAIAAAGLHDAASGGYMLAFTPVAAAGALLWGYGARLWGAARSIARFMRLTLWLSLVCTLLSLPPLVLAVGRWPSHPDAVLTQVVLDYLPYEVGIFVANGFFVLVDKLVTAFIALAILDAGRRRWPWAVPLLDREAR